MSAEEAVVVHYERQDDMVRLTLNGLTNHELRAVLVGLWARLEADDRADFINELKHYAPLLNGVKTRDRRQLGPISAAIAKGTDSERSIDIMKRRAAEHGKEHGSS